MQSDISKALSYWQVAIQYLDLSEKVAGLIALKGNKWVFIQEGFDLDTLEKEHEEATRWTDYHQGIPVIFNFYHGLELLLKGFLIAVGKKSKNHKISKLHAQVKELYSQQEFMILIEKYINPDLLPEFLKTFTQDSSISIDDWYQAFKYPESIKGELFAHNKLQFQTDKGAEFFDTLSSDIHKIRLSSVNFARNSYQGIA